MPTRKLLSPVALPIYVFAGAILLGAAFLRSPASHAGPTVPFLDALFTATSATCVTGLAVVDTGTAFSTFGQTVILVLIQLGGLGIMTYTSLFFYLWRRRVSLTDHIAVGQSLLQDPSFHLGHFLLRVVAGVAIIEAAGALFLHLFDPVGFSPFSAVFIPFRPSATRDSACSRTVSCATGGRRRERGHHGPHRSRRARLHRHRGIVPSGPGAPAAPGASRSPQASHLVFAHGPFHQRRFDRGRSGPAVSGRIFRPGGAGRVVHGPDRPVSVRHQPHSRVQHPGHRPDGRDLSGDHDSAHVHRRVPGVLRRGHQDHHLRVLVASDGPRCAGADRP